MNTPDFVLSAHEFDIVWGELDLGRMPYPLDVPSTGRTLEQRAQLAAEVYRELGDRGLARGQRVDADLEALLLVLAHYDVAVDAIGHIGYPVRALAAARGANAVLAVLAGGELWLREIRPTALARSIVEVLPDGNAGPGQAMSLPYQALAEAAEPQEDEDDPYGGDLDERIVLSRAGVSRNDAGALLELANNRRAGGQLGVTIGGRRTERLPTLVTWFDTHQGRYLMVREDSWLSIAPADNERIEQRVATVLAGAR
ncbi:ESX secretion-associated protein EspG [Amycolatopsis magusensis]|uniref:EspG family protein n=1 Tax=Amycolatopsis magusensis TaxID=882444 RepID=A0ABS4PU80_9PSEU|nr:ESX secretion-associated protein EspG [Amycolatopsis magusensis]MBP2182988.1 hypothetical protein [Amycolatopsis magusensis]MDI5981967.1 ESX secretion-associated protein EspG [Amycolatopsis magusensis]